VRLAIRIAPRSAAVISLPRPLFSLFEDMKLSLIGKEVEEQRQQVRIYKPKERLRLKSICYIIYYGKLLIRVVLKFW
jgi:hypothetical protein